MQSWNFKTVVTWRDEGEVLQCYELCNIIVRKEILPHKVDNGVSGIKNGYTD